MGLTVLSCQFFQDLSKSRLGVRLARTVRPSGRLTDEARSQESSSRHPPFHSASGKAAVAK